MTLKLFKHTVTAEEAKARLDTCLAKQLKISRSQAQKLMQDGRVLIDGQLKPKHYRLKSGNQIMVRAEKNQTASTDSPPQVQIIKATNNYIILNKPAGLVVHPDAHHGLGQTVIGQLLSQFPDLTELDTNHQRFGVVHRLDKPVSGIMIVARKQPMYQHLKAQFKHRKINKVYLALVHGRLNKTVGVLDFVITRKKTGFMAARPAQLMGRQAVTQFAVLQTYRHYSLVKAKPATGRTHQLRVHFQAYNHPLVGEKTYIDKKRKNNKLNLSLDRIFLHASQLGFFDLKNQHQLYRVPLPKKLQDILYWLDDN